jgi:DNA-binding LytR/AlgR family response regulator
MSKILLKTGRGTFNIVETEEIVYVERLKARSRVFLKDKDLRVNIPFIDLLAKLGVDFQQCHRKYLVNLTCVKKFNNRNLLLNNNISLPIGLQYKDQFTEKLISEFDNTLNRKSI